jgi:hypothetical protein
VYQPQSAVHGYKFFQGGIAFTTDQSRSSGYYHSSDGKRRAIIEWKQYDHRWATDTTKEVLTSLDALVDLFDPVETPRTGVLRRHLLDCVGYFHQPAKFRIGIVFVLPEAVSEASEMKICSLHTIIKITDPNNVPDSTRPDLGDVFDLAKAMSYCLFRLHEHDWYHKNISSHSILLLSSQDNFCNQLGSAVLVGFGDSRESRGISFGPKSTGRLYLHPSYIGNVPFQKTFDYYGLGIVLLELGLWLPISLLREDHSDIESDEEFR